MALRCVVLGVAAAAAAAAERAPPQYLNLTTLEAVEMGAPVETVGLSDGTTVGYTPLLPAVPELELTYVHGFMAAEECDGMVTTCDAREGWKRSTVELNKLELGDKIKNEIRTSSSCTMIPPGPYMAQIDLVRQKAPHLLPELTLVDKLSRRAAELLEVPESAVEPLQLVRYQAGGEKFGPHYDARGSDDDANKRRYTLLVFASDAPAEDACPADADARRKDLTVLDEARTEAEAALYGAGGHLRFPRLGLSVRPRKGDAVVWANTVDSDRTSPLHDSLHEGMPVLWGEKYAVNVWTRWGDPDS